MNPFSLTATVALVAPMMAVTPEAIADTYRSSESPPAVADPAAPVPAITYRSVLAPPRPDDRDPQPADWRAANAAVGEFPRGHIDLLKWEGAQDAGSATAPAASPAARSAPPAVPATPAAPAPAPRSPANQPHGGHR